MIGAIIAAIGAHLGYAFGDLFLAKGARKVGTYSNAFWVVSVSLIISTFFVWAFDWVSGVTLGMLAFTVFLSAVLNLSVITFNKGMEQGNATVVGTIAGAFPAAVVILSILFYEESLNSTQTLFVTLALIGIVVSSFNFKEALKNKLKFDKTVFYALITFIGWGSYFTFIRTPIEAMGWFWAQYIAQVTGVTVFALLFFKKIKNVPSKQPKALPIIITTALLTTGATYAFSYAIENGQSSIIAPIAGSYPALFAVLSYYVFKDKIIPQQVFGIILTLVGVVGLTFVG